MTLPEYEPPDWFDPTNNSDQQLLAIGASIALIVGVLLESLEEVIDAADMATVSQKLDEEVLAYLRDLHIFSPSTRFPKPGTFHGNQLAILKAFIQTRK